MSNVNAGTATALPDGVRSAARFVFNWIPLVVVTVLWEFASGTAVPAEVLPAPSVVAGEIRELLVTGEVFSHLFVSLFRISVGLALSIAAGILLGIGMARLDPVENFFEVLLALTYPIPKTALVPLAILWLGVGTQTAILIVFLACLLPIVMNAYNAAENVDQNLVWAAKMMGTDGRQLFWKVIIPASIPEILTGIRQAIPIAFIALVSAELIASNQGIGYLILTAGQVGNYPTMFANLVIISAVAYFAVRGFEIGRERGLSWT